MKNLIIACAEWEKRLFENDPTFRMPAYKGISVRYARNLSEFIAAQEAFGQGQYAVAITSNVDDVQRIYLKASQDNPDLSIMKLYPMDQEDQFQRLQVESKSSDIMFPKPSEAAQPTRMLSNAVLAQTLKL